MKKSAAIIVFLLLALIGALLGLVASQVYKYATKPEFSPSHDQIVETIHDPGIPDVTGRKKGLVQLSSPGLFKSDKERKEWLEKWAHDKETIGYATKGGDIQFYDPLTEQHRSVEEAFGSHRVIPTTGGAEDEAPFYPSTPVEYAMLQTDLMGEHWYGGSRVILIPDEDCACVCCPCCPCPGGLPSPEEVITPIEYPDIPETLRRPVKPPKWPPINPPVYPPIDPPGPPKVPEASTIWLLAIGLIWLGRRI